MHEADVTGFGGDVKRDIVVRCLDNDIAPKSFFPGKLVLMGNPPVWFAVAKLEKINELSYLSRFF